MVAGRITPKEDANTYTAGLLARLDKVKTPPHLRVDISPAPRRDTVALSGTPPLTIETLEFNQTEIADSSPALFEQEEGTKPEDLGFMLLSGGKMGRGEVIAAVSATRAERTMGL